MYLDPFQRVKPYLPDLKFHCLKLAKNEWDAEDLMQEVLAKVYRSLQRMPDRELSKAYMRQIATRAWIDHCRSMQAKLPAEMFDETLHQPVSTPANEWSVREMFQQLAERLNVRQMVLILLVDIFQFTAPETAQLLHMTQGAVKEGLKRARQRLLALASQPREAASANVRPPSQSISKETFEQFLAAFRAGDAHAICHSYLLLANSGVQVEKVAATGTRVFFTFRDPNGHLVSFFQDF